MLFGKYVNKYYLKYGVYILLGLVALIMVDVFQLKIPELYRTVINGMNGDGVGANAAFDLEFLLDEICLPLIFIILALLGGRFLWRICLFGTAIKVESDLRYRMFDHCKDLSHQYYQANSVGNLMALFTNDLETIHECFGMGIMMLFDAMFLGGLAIFKMWRMDVLLTVLSLFPMLLLLTVALIVGKYMSKKWETRQESFSSLSEFAQESFSGISVIKAFVKEARELWAFKKLNVDNENANVDYTRLSTLLKIFVTLLVESVICIILGYGGYLVYNDSFSAGELIEFIGYFNAIVWPVMAISELIELRSKGKASLKRISALLDAKQDVFDRGDMEEAEQIKGKIEFKNLSFRYPDGDRDVLKNISFTINEGENVGIIGKTGSGKTTVIDLILRTYNIGDNMLFIDGHDVNHLPIKTVRNACAYVPQDNFLFSDTIESNIAFAKDEAHETEIEDAAVLSDVNADIKGFTSGYATMLGERGVTVSGGQKQRISIARALIKNAPILILDDSVSAVDTKTERVILQNLSQSRKGKTTILIAHRISSVERMDKIILIDKGSVIAIGTHKELLESCEDYKTMVKMQKLEDEGGGNND